MIKSYTVLIFVLMLTLNEALCQQRQSRARSESATKHQQKPNIVFILADDLGYKDLACYGNPFNETPHLDSLAKSGLKFNQAYSACPVCSPARAAILTGKYPARLHLTNFIAGDRRDTASTIAPAEWTKYLPPAEITLAEILREQGYVTGITGKWHLTTAGKADSTAAHNQGFDFDRIIDKNGLDYYNYTITSKGKTIYSDAGTSYITDQITSYATDFIDANKTKPFFLYVPYSAPHVVIVPKAQKLGKYLFKYNKFDGRYNPNYAAVVESLDEGVGRIIAKLRKEGLLENTILIFTSDNGGVGLDELGPIPTTMQPLRAWKGHVYEGGIRVPLIVSWKNTIQAGRETESYITGTDYLPTLLELLDIKSVPAKVDGKSFVSLIRSPGSSFNRGPVFWHYPHFSNQLGRPGAAVRLGNYKLVELYESGKLELYDLSQDISEANDLSARLPDKTRELHRLLDQWRTDVSANMPVLNKSNRK